MQLRDQWVNEKREREIRRESARERRKGIRGGRKCKYMVNTVNISAI
jgi:hypothetical protein